MPGICGAITEKCINNIDLLSFFHKEKGVSYIVNKINYNNSYFGRLTIDKFQNDKLFEERSGILICIEGVILNKACILKETGFKNLSDYLYNEYIIDNMTFPKKLRGNFSGFVFDKKKKKLIVFTDHTAAKPIYYFVDNHSKSLIFSSELKVVLAGMSALKFSSHLNINGAYCLLSFGYMIGDISLAEDVHKLPPGTVLVFENNQIQLLEYYKLSSTPYIEDTQENIIKELDRRFSEAIDLEYAKDREYGYEHIATLSGGLDSRTNVAYAKKRGFENIICINFSESNYLDEKIAKIICSENDMEYIFCSLDHGNYLTKFIREIVESNDGLILYSGSAHVYSCIRKISFSDMGLIHTGMIGDFVMGSYLQNKVHKQLNENIISKTSYSTLLLDNASDYLKSFNSYYENDELFALYGRCINGAFNGFRMIEQFTEFSSPFLYIDFLDYAMKIHPKSRFKESIYLKWINKMVPEYCKYKWEKYGIAPRYPLTVLELYRALSLIVKIIYTKSFGPSIKKISNNPRFQRTTSMNPTEHWWYYNKYLQNQFNMIFNDNIDLFDDRDDLKQDCVELYEKGTFMEKSQVITLLMAVNMLKLDRKSGNAKSETE